MLNPMANNMELQEVLGALEQLSNLILIAFFEEEMEWLHHDTPYNRDMQTSHWTKDFCNFPVVGYCVSDCKLQKFIESLRDVFHSY